MFHDLLSSRTILAGLVFFVLVVSGLQLYSWHVRRTSEAELARTNQVVQQLENKKKTRPSQEAEAPTDTESLGVLDTPLETDDTQIMSDEIATVKDEDSKRSDTADAFLHDDTVSEEEPVDAPYGVSPYGFGPYPEVPADYPEQDIWDDISTRSMKRDHELIARVQIELWNQGVQTLGAVFDGKYRRIYPIRDDTVYIEWAQNLGSDGKPYVSRWLTSPSLEDSYFPDILKGTLPSHITVYEFPAGGIGPYDFLDLPR